MFGDNRASGRDTRHRISNGSTDPAEILIRQGKRYKAVFDVFKRQAEHIQSVTFWGLADDRTWLKTFPITRINLPLLFDEQLQASFIDPQYGSNFRNLVGMLEHTHYHLGQVSMLKKLITQNDEYINHQS